MTQARAVAHLDAEGEKRQQHEPAPNGYPFRPACEKPCGLEGHPRTPKEHHPIPQPRPVQRRLDDHGNQLVHAPHEHAHPEPQEQEVRSREHNGVAVGGKRLGVQGEQARPPREREAGQKEEPGGKREGNHAYLGWGRREHHPNRKPRFSDRAMTQVMAHRPPSPAS